METTITPASHWLEEAVDQGYLNFHDFNKFSDFISIGDGPFGEVYRTQWQIRGMIVALKSWMDATSREEKQVLNGFINELKMHRKVDYHPNILRFYGVSQDLCSKKYLLVLEYADGGTLRQYLKQNHSLLTWADKISLARQVTSGVACLHDNGISLGELHANNILIKEGAIKISDISLSKQFSRMSDTASDIRGDIAYVEPQNLKSLKYSRNDKSDIYSIGVLLWEISSGRPPFQTSISSSTPPTAISQIQIAERISNGEREEPVKGTPREYVEIYRQCWKDDPSERPNIHEVLTRLLNIEIPVEHKDEDLLLNGGGIDIPSGVGSTRPIKTRRASGGKVSKGGADDKILSSSPAESASSDGTLCSVTDADQMSKDNDKKSSTNVGGKKSPTGVGGKKSPTNLGGKKSPTNLGGKKPPTNLGGKKLSINSGEKKLSINLGGQKSPTSSGGKKSPTSVGKKSPTEIVGMKSPIKETVRKKSLVDTNGKKIPTIDTGNKTSTERLKSARRISYINTEISQPVRKAENRRSSFNGVPSGNTSPTTPTTPNSAASKKMIMDNTDAAFFEDLLNFFINILEISGDFPAMISSIKEYLHNKSREHKSTFKSLIKHKDNPSFGSIIGFFYENSIGTVQDKQAAFNSYKKSADSGDAIGQYFLGRCYYGGVGIKTDRKKAFELLKKSSENGNSRGQWMLGFCYERGYGTAKDLKKAFEQFLQSAEAGNVTSQMELGRCYEEGIGVDKNLGKAIECYQHAFARGHVLANKRIEALKKMQRRSSSVIKVGPKE